jgi:uncharacterized membrane protein YphA (DoxX/SURF4 family)
MFYRVDYTLAVMAVGFVVGCAFSRRAEDVPASCLARRYYIAVAALAILRTLAFAASMVAPEHGPWSTVGGVLGDLMELLFAALFGLAVRRRDRREFLLEPQITAALCLSVAFAFALVGVGKAFSMEPMTEFFSQSGYSVPFLKFIVIAEVFGALGLLLPWAAPAAIVGLSIDMFGAVLTHVHNHDPLNDSTEAIALLIRLTALAILVAMRPHAGAPVRKFRQSLATVAAAGVLCLLLALAGSAAMRHLGPPPSVIPAPR